MDSSCQTGHSQRPPDSHCPPANNLPIFNGATLAASPEINNSNTNIHRNFHFYEYTFDEYDIPLNEIHLPIVCILCLYGYCHRHGSVREIFETIEYDEFPHDQLSIQDPLVAEGGPLVFVEEQESAVLPVAEQQPPFLEDAEFAVPGIEEEEVSPADDVPPAPVAPPQVPKSANKA